MTKEGSNSTLKTALSWALLGTAVGVAAGILLAPDSGKNTVSKLSNEMDGVKKSIKDLMSDLTEGLKERFTHTMETLAGRAEDVEEAVQEKVTKKTAKA